MDHFWPLAPDLLSSEQEDRDIARAILAKAGINGCQFGLTKVCFPRPWNLNLDHAWCVCTPARLLSSEQEDRDVARAIQAKAGISGCQCSLTKLCLHDIANVTVGQNLPVISCVVLSTAGGP